REARGHHPRALRNPARVCAHREAEPRLDHRRTRDHRGDPRSWGRRSRGSEELQGDGVRAFIGLGSNLGDREANVRQALEHLAHAPETSVVRASSLYDTEPVGAEEQPHFLNAVAQLETQLTPHQLLWNLMLIERRLGRVRTQRWG